MTTTKIEIAMSERRPVNIDPEEWPVIARADSHDGQSIHQANNIRYIRVRQHRDGRRIVYGWQEAGNGGQHVGAHNPHAGYLVAAVDGATADDSETVRAIRRVGGVLGDDVLADACITELPAEDI